MDDLNGIAETLRRQREDLERQFDDTGVSSAETSRLVERIEELRKRMERSHTPPSEPPPR